MNPRKGFLKPLPLETCSVPLAFGTLFKKLEESQLVDECSPSCQKHGWALRYAPPLFKYSEEICACSPEPLQHLTWYGCKVYSHYKCFTLPYKEIVMGLCV